MSLKLNHSKWCATGLWRTVAFLGLICLLGAPKGFTQQDDAAAVPVSPPSNASSSVAPPDSSVPTSVEPQLPAQAPGFSLGATTTVATPVAPLPSGLPGLSTTPGGATVPSDSGPVLNGRDVSPVAIKDVESARRFRYAFRLTLSTTYDDNIFLAPKNKEDDVYFVINPGLTFGFGDVVSREANYIRLDYSPQAFLYAKHDKEDNLQHLIRLSGKYNFSRLTVSLSQDVEILSGADVSSIGTGAVSAGVVPSPVSQVNLDTNSRTDLDIYSTNVSLAYDLSGKIAATAGAQFSISDYSTLLSSESLSGNLYLDYAYSEKLSFGGGVTGGVLLVDDPTPDQTFIQGNLRTLYTVTGKVTVAGSAGLEYRLSDGRDGDRVTPVFELSAFYRPNENTTISLSTNRRVLASAVLGGQDFASTGVTLGVTQLFFQRISFGVTSGFENSEYVSELNGVQANREDNYYFVQPSIDYRIRDFLSFGVYYVHRQNFSQGSNSSFADNQVGVSMSLTF